MEEHLHEWRGRYCFWEREEKEEGEGENDVSDNTLGLKREKLRFVWFGKRLQRRRGATAIADNNTRMLAAPFIFFFL